MKKTITLFALFLLMSYQVLAVKSYEMEVYNLAQINECTFTFDVRMRNTSSPFEPYAIELIQWRFSFNTAMMNGGGLRNSFLTYVNGTTDLVGVVVPNTAGFTSDQVYLQWGSDALNIDAQTTLFSDVNWKRIGTFSVKLSTASAGLILNNFSDVALNLQFVANQVIVNECSYYEDAGLCYRAAEDFTIIGSQTLTNSIDPNQQLAGYFMNTGTDWGTATNWNNTVANTHPAYHQMPVATNNALVGVASNISATTSVSVNNIYFKTPGSLSIASTASGTGSLIHSTPGVTAMVERYITAGTWADGTDGWHLLSSPVAAQAIDPEFTSSGGGEYDFYAWSEPAQVWLNQKVGANNITTFNVGQGYLAAYQNTDTKVFSGALNIADKSVTLTQNAGTYTGWNLLGNPYSSALTWNTGWTLTNIGGVAQIWNEGIKDYSLINAGAAIPAMNGFMVYTSVASQSLTIPAAQRVHSATAWYKSAAQQIELIAHDPQGESAKSSFIGFDSKATAGFDLEYDAYLLSGYAPKFYSVAGGSEFSLNTLPEAVSNLTIPFGFVKNASSSFSIELAQSIEGHSVWLRDLLTNTVVNLSDTPVYSFTSADGDNAARFEIVLDMFTGTSDLKALASAYAYSADNRIVVTGVNGETKMDVISIQGQVLKTFEFFSTGQHDVSVNLSTGVYLVRLYNSGEIRAMKVMVK